LFYGSKDMTMSDLREHLILYVDDERANRIVFEQSFGKKFRVKCVVSGEEALAVAAEETVAVLITDMRMPGMSGEQLLVRFRDVSPDSLRIVVTAYSDVDPILRAVNEGLVVRYIVKPWDRAELEEILRWALEAYVLGKQGSALQLRLIETERLMTLGQVSAHVLHDINNLLGGLSPNLEFLEELATTMQPVLRAALAGEPLKLDARERALLETYANDLPALSGDLRNSAKYMTDLLVSLRAFRDKTAAPNEPRDVDPILVIRRVLMLSKHGATATKSKLDYVGPDVLPRVRATDTELMQVVLNLVRNAQQAFESMGPGGEIAIDAVDEGAQLRFSVRDTGPGMPAAVLDKIGTPFFTTRSEGTGLGVAQCKRLVGRLGGDLEIKSETTGRNRGTTVTFTIPKVS
jgi:two-component system, sensor histidine kinase and response regulator